MDRVLDIFNYFDLIKNVSNGSYYHWRNINIGIFWEENGGNKNYNQDWFTKLDLLFEKYGEWNVKNVMNRWGRDS